MLIPCTTKKKLLTSRDSIRKQLPVPCDCSIVLVLLVYTSLDNSQHSLRYITRYLFSLFFVFVFFHFFFSFIFDSLMYSIACIQHVYVYIYVYTKAQSDNFCEEHIREVTFDFDVAFLSIYFRLNPEFNHFDCAFLASQR